MIVGYVSQRNGMTTGGVVFVPTFFQLEYRKIGGRVVHSRRGVWGTRGSCRTWLPGFWEGGDGERQQLPQW